MKWLIGLKEGNEKWVLEVSAKLSEKQQVLNHIRVIYPNAEVVYASHDSELLPDKREKGFS